MYVQLRIQDGFVELVWSHILEFENAQNALQGTKVSVPCREMVMLTDTELKTKALEILLRELGLTETERFVSLLQRDSFDYTEWRRSLWQNKSVEHLNNEAMAFRKKTRDP